jgi:dihydroorotase
VLGTGAGTLTAGAPADLCLFDPSREWVVSAEALASQGRNTPFLGRTLTGRVVRTFVAGRSVHAA